MRHRSADSHIADFDSAAAMMKALANLLRGTDFPALGKPRWLEPLAKASNRLPWSLRQAVYTWSGASEAIPEKDIATVDEEAMGHWAAAHYPQRRYPAVAVGACNGALLHLWAALGIPWLPQTLLIPVRQGRSDPDDFAGALAAGRRPGEVLLARNPRLQLHQMHDPSQDRLMARRMLYFRVKWHCLTPAYERFLESALAPGGTIFLVDGRITWPTTRVGARHVFQAGGVGGMSAEEYLHGSPRSVRWLAEQGAARGRWEPPPPDDRSPEAEWGFEPRFADDLAHFAETRGFRIIRVSFDTPEAPAPLVAELYRWWYRRRGLSPDELLVASFILCEPYWTLRRGLVPFWMAFNTDVSLRALRQYLDESPQFQKIFLTLFSQGVRSLGVPDIAAWRAQLDRAQEEGAFLGVDPKAFPADFAVFARFNQALRRLPGDPLPLAQLSLGDLQRFLAQHGGRFPVRWEPSDGTGRVPRAI